ncbi:unnamed protein product [Peniophora sp. CBMAI 1063]|nr:unnamed protein product [Peniophora sp. CBMAI 1063]
MPSLSSGGNALVARETISAPVIYNFMARAHARYPRIVGRDLMDPRSDVYRRLSGCRDYTAVIRVIDNVAEEFKIYRNSRNGVGTAIRSSLSTIVRALFNFGALEVGRDAVSVQLPGVQAVFVALIYLLKATQGVSERFDMVADLLERLTLVVPYLSLRVQAPLGPASEEVVVKIHVHLLRCLAIIIDTMSQSRIRHYASVVFGRRNPVAKASKKLEVLLQADTSLLLAEIRQENFELFKALKPVLTYSGPSIAYSGEDTSLVISNRRALLAHHPAITNTAIMTSAQTQLPTFGGHSLLMAGPDLSHGKTENQVLTNRPSGAERKQSFMGKLLHCKEATPDEGACEGRFIVPTSPETSAPLKETVRTATTNNMPAIMSLSVVIFVCLAFALPSVV